MDLDLMQIESWSNVDRPLVVMNLQNEHLGKTFVRKLLVECEGKY